RQLRTPRDSTPNLQAHGHLQNLSRVRRDLKVGVVDTARLKVLGVCLEAEHGLLRTADVRLRQAQPGSVALRTGINPLAGTGAERDLPVDDLSGETTLGNLGRAHLDDRRLGKAHALKKLLDGR